VRCTPFAALFRLVINAAKRQEIAMARQNPRKLTDILQGHDLEELTRRFDHTEPAAELEPVPPGRYEVDFVDGEVRWSSRGTLGYTCKFEISAGDFRGQRLWHTLWLSDDAMAYSLRDLKKLGISSLAQMEQLVPPGIFCFVQVAMRTGDDGVQRNTVTRIYPGGVRSDTMADPDFAGPPSPGNTPSSVQAQRPDANEGSSGQEGGVR
jgi:hypothetical protein